MKQSSAFKTLRFSRKDPKKFFQTLNKRVNEHFQKNKALKTGNWQLYVKTVIMFSLLLTPYFLILLTELNPWLKLLLAIIMGVGMAGVGMNVCTMGITVLFQNTIGSINSWEQVFIF